jgi:hypothetical protein
MIGAALIGLVVGCAPQPSEQVTRQTPPLLREQFDQAYAWRPRLAEAYGIDFRVEGGAYRARSAQTGFVSGLNADLHTDVVIEVETTQLSDERNNAYGVLCRASPNNDGDGYYFLISGDGYASIRRGVTERVEGLVDWAQTGSVNQDRGVNRIRAVCVGDYLALYVNDQFVAETRDRRYSEGYAGLTAAVAEGGTVDVAFDDLTIWAARLD